MFFPVLFDTPPHCGCTLNSGTNAAGTYQWEAITNNGSITVAVCYRGGLGTSPNVAYSSDHGQTWTQGTLLSGDAADYLFTGIKWNGSIWLATPWANSTVYTSSDGINWTSTATGSFLAMDSTYNSGIDTIGTTFYGPWSNANSTNIYTSTNGTSWSAHAVLPASHYWRGVANNGTTAVAISSGSSGAGTNIGAYQAVGSITSAWTQSTMPWGAAYNWCNVIWTGHCFIANTWATTSRGKGARSYDGITWTALTVPSTGYDSSGNGPYDVDAYGNMFSDGDGAIWLPVCRINTGTPQTTKSMWCSADDGDNWTLITLPQASYWMAHEWTGQRLCGLAGGLLTGGSNLSYYSNAR